ncbi:Cl-channel clc-7 [Reticulomyxa filosa]|uniref:Cl-channel clc-7 n=1 Tax=Reticulomyxa filosa TaxID=46433 RepID=X6MXD2_RETFI|nr:Cl-channel clc-7 [Reticulomyxa filosa]|eukprot:ETO17740.1 Cl-channel clc-7 [Reticulomyxa filosa]
MRWRKLQVTGKWRKIAEVMVVSLITSLCILGIPFFFGCQPVSIIEQDCADYSKTDSRCRSLATFGQFTCEEGYYNPTGQIQYTHTHTHTKQIRSMNKKASLLFGRSENIISGLFHRDSHQWFPLGQVLVCFMVYYGLVLLACGIAVPAGLFIPLILIGATLGHGMGQAYNKVFGLSLDVGVYALLGSAATLGGVTRMTMLFYLFIYFSLCPLNLKHHIKKYTYIYIYVYVYANVGEMIDH